MSGTELDTDTLLAMLSSLLHPEEFEQTVLLDALITFGGDLEVAAHSLRSERPKKRRKVVTHTGIEGWLKGRKSPEITSTSNDASPSHACVTVSDRSAPSSSSTSKAKGVTGAELTTKFGLASSSASNSKARSLRLPPLTLSTPELVAEHTPCTMHYLVLPPELACRLYYTLLCASAGWQRASGHAATFYRRGPNPSNALHEETEYWYQGRQRDMPPTFPAPMEEACQIVERVVNAEMRKRPRFPLEWGGYATNEGEYPILWCANVAASNCYVGAKENICFHSDQLTHLGPYPTIASLSLGVSRTFRLREVVPSDEKDERSARTFNIPLRHNSLVIMHASTQEMFKHAVPPQSSIDMFHPPFPPPPSLTDDKARLLRLQGASNVRINVTFRFFRPDFLSRTIPRCECGIPCILRPDMKNRYEEPSALLPGSETRTLAEAGSSNASYQASLPSSSAKATHTTKKLGARYWWACAVGGKNDGQGCRYWKVMDVKAEGRGPFVGDPQ